MRICIVYDCLFPWTIGGAERWYRGLAERLAEAGNDVTYLTQRQWPADEPPVIPGVTVVAVAPLMPLYAGDRRRIWPPIRFGIGVLIHLLRRGGRYDIVHLASFPYFPLLAAALAARIHRFTLVCDWFEVWSAAYWRGYLGRVGGRIGWLVQRLCAAVPQRANVFSALHAARLRAIGLKGEAVRLSGLHEGDGSDVAHAAPPAEPPLLVYAGRMIPEKRVPLLVDAIALAIRDVPDLRAILYGRGPDAARVRTRIEAQGLVDRVTLPGFAPAEDVVASMASALCVVQPSAREGYGLVVAEAAALGVPAIVVAGEDNAAVELIEPGINGFVAPLAEPEALAAEIVRCRQAGPALRAATRDWYGRNARRLSLAASLKQIVDGYAGSAPRGEKVSAQRLKR